jgi:hypothetical protein
MSCKQVEKLIALYVESDLDAEAMRSVDEHVHSCHACASLTSRYKASQEWLHSLTVPEFDDAFYADLTASVMREVKGREPRPSIFQWFAFWWKPAYGLAFLLLVMLGAIAFYVQFNKPATKSNQGPIVNEKAPDQPQPEPKNRPEEKLAPQPPAPAPEPLPQQATNNGRPSIRRQSEVNNVTKLTPANLDPIIDSQISLKFADEISAEEMSEYGTFISSREEEMTRIEIQTADPNIRIIWFAPKTVDLPKTITE